MLQSYSRNEDIERPTLKRCGAPCLNFASAGSGATISDQQVEFLSPTQSDESVLEAGGVADERTDYFSNCNVGN